MKFSLIVVYFQLVLSVRNTKHISNGFIFNWQRKTFDNESLMRHKKFYNRKPIEM